MVNKQFKKNSFEEHYKWIDYSQGIGCLLVLLGHSIQATEAQSQSEFFYILNTIIYSFHMPLFFFLSGYLSFKLLEIDKKEYRLQWLKKRAKRLLVPYFFVGIVWMFPKLIFQSFVRSEWTSENLFPGFLFGDNPNSTLWFLWALFVIDVIVALSINKLNLLKALTISSAISIMSLAFCSPYSNVLAKIIGVNSAMVIHRTIDNFPLFLLGITIRIFYKKEESLKSTNFLLGSTQHNLPLPYNQPIPYYQNSISIIYLMVSFILGNFILLVYKLPWAIFITSISGSLLTCLLSIKISSRGQVMKPLLLAGDFCMDIYIIGEMVEVALRILLVQKLHFNYIFCIVIITIVSFYVSIFISRMIIRKSRLLKTLVLGIQK